MQNQNIPDNNQPSDKLSENKRNPAHDPGKNNLQKPLNETPDTGSNNDDMRRQQQYEVDFPGERPVEKDEPEEPLRTEKSSKKPEKIDDKGRMDNESPTSEKNKEESEHL